MAHLPLWYISKIDPSICDSVVEELSKLPTKDAAMGIQGEHADHVHRNTTVRFAEAGYWFDKMMVDAAIEGNRVCRWEFHVTHNENIQYAEYGPEQHYNWHVDLFPLSGRPYDRKLTAVCLLNDPSEFTGGEFQVRLYSEYTAPLEKGTIISFPSALEHRVVPVLSGLRKTATIWLNGPRFR